MKIEIKKSLTNKLQIVKEFIFNHKSAVGLFILSIIGIVLNLIGKFCKDNFISNDFPEWSIFLIGNLSYGLLISVYIWFVFSYLPEKKRKDMLKRGLSSSYDGFRESLIHYLIIAIKGEYDFDLLEKLSDYNNLRDYFEDDNSHRKDLIIKQFNRQPLYRCNLLIQFELFEREISNVLNANILDAESHRYFSTISRELVEKKLRHASILTSGNLDFDDFDKSLMSYIWFILTSWGRKHGLSKEDPIKEEIQKI